jgi:osmoprotectant transport system substrate-binding protein
VNRLHRHGLALALALIASLALLAACGGDDGGDADGPGGGASVTVADKGFSESSIVAQLYAQALEGQGFDVNVTSLGSTEIADSAIRKGDIDLYPEYTGTAFLNVLGRAAADAPAEDTESAVFDQVAEAYTERGLTALPPAPYTNGNEVACTEEAAEEHGIATLSDLGRASADLVYSANAEHLTRDDGLPLLRSEYGVDFKDVITVDISLRYRPIEDGDADCVYAFGTDPKLATLPLVVLEDDKGTFSAGVPFQTFPVVSTAFLEGLSDEARTALESTLAEVNELLTADDIRALLAKVDFDQEDPSDVADEFLASNLEESS